MTEKTEASYDHKIVGCGNHSLTKHGRGTFTVADYFWGDAQLGTVGSHSHFKGIFPRTFIKKHFTKDGTPARRGTLKLGPGHGPFQPTGRLGEVSHPPSHHCS